MRSFFLFLAAILFTSGLFAEDKERWVAYYSDKAPIEAFDPYSLIVLDSDDHPTLEALKEGGKTLLGYLSLGEVENNRWWYPDVKNEGILLHENKLWPGSFFVDLRDPRWAKRVIEDLIPCLLHMGFDGLFLDTLDNAEELEHENLAAYQGMTQAAAHLVMAIKMHYPHIPVMVNRAYFLLPETVGIIDMELGEDVMTTYDFKKKKYLKQPKDIYEEQVKLLKEAKKGNPKLKVYTLDYWYPDKAEYIKKIYQTERENGFIPYVGTIELDKIVPEPK